MLLFKFSFDVCSYLLCRHRLGQPLMILFYSPHVLIIDQGSLWGNNFLEVSGEDLTLL
jgi:hypothetical protein